MSVWVASPDATVAQKLVRRVVLASSPCDREKCLPDRRLSKDARGFFAHAPRGLKIPFFDHIVARVQHGIA
jgi:hypothetical protein